MPNKLGQDCLPLNLLSQKRNNIDIEKDLEDIKIEKIIENNLKEIEETKIGIEKIKNEINKNTKKIHKDISDSEIIDLNSNAENKNDPKKIKDNYINNKNINNNNSSIQKDNINNAIKSNSENKTLNNVSEELNTIKISNNNTNVNNNLLGNNSISKKGAKSEKSKSGEKIKNNNDKVNILMALEGLKNERDKDILFIPNEGFEFDTQICGLRVRMGPFISERKAKSVLKYIQINENIMKSMSLDYRKDWLKNLSLMIEELID